MKKLRQEQQAYVQARVSPVIGPVLVGYSREFPTLNQRDLGRDSDLRGDVHLEDTLQHDLD